MKSAVFVWTFRIVLCGFLLYEACTQISAQARGHSTYFAWRTPQSPTWLRIESYDAGDPRPDLAVIENPSHDTQVCIKRFALPDEPPTLVCKSTEDVARWLRDGR